MVRTRSHSLASLVLILITICTYIKAFSIENNLSNCVSLVATISTTDEELTSTAGYIAQLSYSSNFNDPVLYNQTIFWNDYTKLDSVSEMDHMQLTRISYNDFGINASLIPYINASWYPRIGPGAYNVQSSLFVYLFTSTDANTSQPHASAPVMQSNGTSSRIAYRISTGADLNCDSYLNPNGTLSGWPYNQFTSVHTNYALQGGLAAMCAVVAILFIVFVFLYLRRRRASLDKGDGKESRDVSSSKYTTSLYNQSKDSFNSDHLKA